MLGGRCPFHCDTVLTCELDVPGTASPSDNDPIEALVILEARKDVEAEPTCIEIGDFMQVVSRAGDPENGRMHGRLHETWVYAA
ncbi:protein of unknown function [Paraburkholderia dioscoreae]|uniref:Uncharacterized protein n=1 Tax=Paraburkholderia dioscoreae TaxID=2604047 RepID=A0A5Q4ZIF2_9BURK|nr:protein of unknown function [Paraburkholderia dioscoreae]